MSAFDKLGMVTALIMTLMTACAEVSAATTASFNSVVRAVGDISSLPHESSHIERAKQALHLATNELELTRKLLDLADDLCLDPAFLTYLNNLTPILDAAQTIRTPDAQPILALAYGLAGARSRLETEVTSLRIWLLINQVANPSERLISPPERFVAVSTKPLLDEDEDLSYANLALDPWG